MEKETIEKLGNDIAGLEKDCRFCLIVNSKISNKVFTRSNMEASELVTVFEIFKFKEIEKIIKG